MNELSNYHLAGLASAFFVTLSLTGLGLQVRFIRERKRRFDAGALADERPTSILSLNRFFVSYLGFYAVLVYGLFLEPMNHYLVWPRVVAVLLLLIILHAIMADRRGAAATGVFALGVTLFAACAPVRLLGAGALTYSVPAAQTLIIIATLLFLQGATHQIIKIRRAGRAGALSLSMHQLFFAKDLSSILFGLAMGLRQGWPLLLFSGASLVMQGLVIWHFRWIKVSPAARRRRLAYPLSD